MLDIIEKCTNLFGEPLPLRYQEKIKNYITNPSPTTDDWENVAHIVANIGDTIWNVVLWMYPDFPRKGRSFDLEGNIVKDWEKVPTGFQVARALQEYFKQLQKYNYQT